MNTLRSVRVGTRRSRLALAQARLVLEQLRNRWPGRNFEVVGIATSGDRMSAAGGPVPAGKGIFTREIELALLDGEIDLAVHSLKDLPTEVPDGLRIAAIPRRARPNDVLISRDGATFDKLKQGAVIGTGSPRRSAQILAARPDLSVRDIRGNIDTRLRKLDEGRYDAVILAYAGLDRLGLKERISEALPVDVMMPAVGQGALAVEIRRDDAEIAGLLDPIHDERSAACVSAERSLLRALGGGCRTPVGALAEIQPGGRLNLRALLGSPDGKTLLRATCTGPLENAEDLGVEAAGKLLDFAG